MTEPFSKDFAEVFTGHNEAPTTAGAFPVHKRIWQRLFIRADGDNDGYIEIIGVGSVDGFRLYAGDEIDFLIDHSSLVLVKGSGEDQFYSWLIV